MSDLAQLTEAIKTGKRQDATAVTQAALDDDTDPQQILDALISGMDDVGRRFKANEVYVPEVLIAARAMKESMALLEPTLVAAGIAPDTTVVLGTVEGDLHDIGKNLVAMMWKGANFNVIDLGTNVPADQFIGAIREHGAAVVGLSALLTTTMSAMKATISAIRDEGLTDVRVVVGGAPVTQKFADEIGADGFAADAASAVDLVRELVAA